MMHGTVKLKKKKKLTIFVSELSKLSDFPYLVPIFTAKHEIKRKYS